MASKKTPEAFSAEEMIEINKWIDLADKADKANLPRPPSTPLVEKYFYFKENKKLPPPPKKKPEPKVSGRKTASISPEDFTALIRGAEPEPVPEVKGLRKLINAFKEGMGEGMGIPTPEEMEKMQFEETKKSLTTFLGDPTRLKKDKDEALRKLTLDVVNLKKVYETGGIELAAHIMTNAAKVGDQTGYNLMTEFMRNGSSFADSFNMTEMRKKTIALTNNPEGKKAQAEEKKDKEHEKKHRKAVEHHLSKVGILLGLIHPTLLALPKEFLDEKVKDWILNKKEKETPEQEEARSRKRKNMSRAFTTAMTFGLLNADNPDNIFGHAFNELLPGGMVDFAKGSVLPFVKGMFPGATPEDQNKNFKSTRDMINYAGVPLFAANMLGIGGGKGGEGGAGMMGLGGLMSILPALGAASGGITAILGAIAAGGAGLGALMVMVVSGLTSIISTAGLGLLVFGVAKAMYDSGVFGWMWDKVKDGFKKDKEQVTLADVKSDPALGKKAEDMFGKPMHKLSETELNHFANHESRRRGLRKLMWASGRRYSDEELDALITKEDSNQSKSTLKHEQDMYSKYLNPEAKGWKEQKRLFGVTPKEVTVPEVQPNVKMDDPYASDSRPPVSPMGTLHMMEMERQILETMRNFKTGGMPFFVNQAEYIPARTGRYARQPSVGYDAWMGMQGQSGVTINNFRGGDASGQVIGSKGSGQAGVTSATPGSNFAVDKAIWGIPSFVPGN